MKFSYLPLFGMFVTALILSCETLWLPSIVVHPSIVAGAPAYEYYGYTPPSNFSALDAHPGAWPSFRFGWEFKPGLEFNQTYIKSYGLVDNGTCYLDIIGYNDSTSVQVLDITGAEPVLRESFKVNRMQLYNTTIPAKTYFKVVSDKPIAIHTGGGWYYSYGGYWGKGSGCDLFYPSTDGGYAGKEFIFMAVYGRGWSERASPGATIHALEKAKVTVYSDKGAVEMEKEMEANTTRTVTLQHRSVYRVISTGRILICTWSQFTVKAVPAPMGGFKSTYFIVWQDAEVQSTPQAAAVFIMTQEKAGHVKIVDMANGQTMIEKDLNPQSLWFQTSKDVDFANKPVMITGTSELSVMAGTVFRTDAIPTNMYSDVTIVGIRPNEVTTIFAISKAVAFSPTATARVTVGAMTLTVPKGRYAELPKGLITVSSNATLVVELISQPAITYEAEPKTLPVAALSLWGTYLLSAEGAELAYTSLKADVSMDVMLYAAVGAIAVVVVVVTVVLLRRSK